MSKLYDNRMCAVNESGYKMASCFSNYFKKSPMDNMQANNSHISTTSQSWFDNRTQNSIKADRQIKEYFYHCVKNFDYPMRMNYCWDFSTNHKNLYINRTTTFKKNSCSHTKRNESVNSKITEKAEPKTALTLPLKRNKSDAELKERPNDSRPNSGAKTLIPTSKSHSFSKEIAGNVKKPSVTSSTRPSSSANNQTNKKPPRLPIQEDPLNTFYVFLGESCGVEVTSSHKDSTVDNILIQALRKMKATDDPVEYCLVEHVEFEKDFNRRNESSLRNRQSVNSDKRIFLKTRVLPSEENLSDLSNNWNQMRNEKKNGFKFAKIILTKKKSIKRIVDIKQNSDKQNVSLEFRNSSKINRSISGKSSPESKQESLKSTLDKQNSLEKFQESSCSNDVSLSTENDLTSGSDMITSSNTSSSLTSEDDEISRLKEEPINTTSKKIESKLPLSTEIVLQKEDDQQESSNEYENDENGEIDDEEDEDEDDDDDYQSINQDTDLIIDDCKVKDKNGKFSKNNAILQLGRILKKTNTKKSTLEQLLSIRI